MFWAKIKQLEAQIDQTQNDNALRLANAALHARHCREVAKHRLTDQAVLPVWFGAGFVSQQVLIRDVQSEEECVGTDADGNPKVSEKELPAAVRHPLMTTLIRAALSYAVAQWTQSQSAD